MFDEDGNEIKITEELHQKVKEKLPFDILEHFEIYMQGLHNELTIGGMPDQHGICNEVALYLTFLETLKKLYWTCAGCDRTISPVEPYHMVNEDSYCIECYNEGI